MRLRHGALCCARRSDDERSALQKLMSHTITANCVHRSSLESNRAERVVLCCVHKQHSIVRTPWRSIAAVLRSPFDVELRRDGCVAQAARRERPNCDRHSRMTRLLRQRRGDRPTHGLRGTHGMAWHGISLIFHSHGPAVLQTIDAAVHVHDNVHEVEVIRIAMD